VGLSDLDEQKCAFCRTPLPGDEEAVNMHKKRIAAGDAGAMFTLGYHYDEGTLGLTQDRTKALELRHQAGELGCADAYYNIGYAYYHGEGVERDGKKAMHYY